MKETKISMGGKKAVFAQNPEVCSILLAKISNRLMRCRHSCSELVYGFANGQH